MRTEREQIEALTRVCVDDLLSGFGLGGLRRGRHFLELLSRVPAQRVARQIANYDKIVGESGLRAGGARRSTCSRRGTSWWSPAERRPGLSVPGHRGVDLPGPGVDAAS